jgi:hypothetical protein
MFGGDAVAVYLGRGREHGSIQSPRSIAVSPENTCIYVVDKGNHRVEVCVYVLSFIDRIPSCALSSNVLSTASR